MPVVTTMTAPTTGRATGSTSPMIPVSELATDVKLVTNAVDTLSICVLLSFALYAFLIIFINPWMATPIIIGKQPKTKPTGIDAVNSFPSSSRDNVSISCPCMFMALLPFSFSW